MSQARARLSMTVLLLVMIDELSGKWEFVVVFRVFRRMFSYVNDDEPIVFTATMTKKERAFEDYGPMLRTFEDDFEGY